MKIILSLVISFALFASCNQNTTQTKAKTYSKGLTELVNTFPNFTDGYKIVYNELNQISEIIGIKDLADGKIKCEYNKAGKLVKLEYYTNNELAFHKDIEWLSDTINITKVNPLSDSTTQYFKESFILNSDGKIAQIIRYVKDGSDKWQKRGSRYEFSWQDGNLLNSKCFVHNDVVADDSVIVELETDGTSLFDLDEISKSIIDEGYVVFYESTYKYDDKANPYTNTSISGILLPNKQNTSKNNPTHITKVYANGDTIQFEYNYEYNENGYPLNTNIEVSSNMEELPNASLSKSIKY